jgi:aminomethyltransferase
MSRSSPPPGTQALQRTFSLLRQLQAASASELQALPLSELARRTGLPRPTAHRLLAALEAEGLVGRHPVDGGYRLGADLTGLGAAALAQRGIEVPRTSPFHERQLMHHASRSYRDWSGYHQPATYDATATGGAPTREYFALRSAAVLIDVSPLFKLDISGPQAFDALQRAITRDLSKCAVGQVLYTAWCDDDGRLLQDGNVVRLAPDLYRVTSAHPSLRWFTDCGVGLELEIADRSEELAALALQGPRSWAVLAASCDDAASVDAARRLGYFRAARLRLAGVEVIVTRSGYTGDLGYELWIERAAALAVWDRLEARGAAHGLIPAGLVALDMARIEAGLVLIDVDYVAAHLALSRERTSSPFEAGIGWTVKLVPGNEFVGRAALEREQARGSLFSTVGIAVEWFELERLFQRHGLRPQSPGHAPSREVTPLYAADGSQAGQATSQVFSPMLKRHIGLASVRSELARPGTALELEMLVELERVRARATVTELPFYDPAHKRAPVQVSPGTPRSAPR